MSNGSNWNLTGNSGTVAGTNFIGTTDAVDFVLKTNNAERLRISSAGNIGINTAPAAGKKLYVINNEIGGYGIYATVSAKNAYAVSGINTSTGETGNHYGVYGSATGSYGDQHYGIYGSSDGTDNENNYGGYFTANNGLKNFGIYVASGETKITNDAAVPTRSDNGSIATSNSGGNRIYFRTNNTNYYVDASGTGDYSEYFRNDENAQLEIGEIAAIDAANYNGVQKASASMNGEERMVGVVSKYGTRNNNDNDGQRHNSKEFVNVGLLGQLPVKVTTENGPIQPGDALTLSQTQPGYATKATAAGNIIGYAMTHYPYKEGEITYPTHTGTQGVKDKLNAPHVMAFIQPKTWIPKAGITNNSPVK